jgi:hypothetical protein
MGLRRMTVAVPLARLELAAERYLRGTSEAAADDATAELVDSFLMARSDAESADALEAETESRRTALMVTCADAWTAADAANVT